MISTVFLFAVKKNTNFYIGYKIQRYLFYSENMIYYNYERRSKGAVTAVSG